ERNLRARGSGDVDAREILAGTTRYLSITAPAAEWDNRIALFGKATDLYGELAVERPEKEALRRNLGTAARYVASLHADKGHTSDAIAYGRRAWVASEATLKGR